MFAISKFGKMLPISENFAEKEEFTKISPGVGVG